jgi:HPt (histidine-containing phosphotransfer) domain-containing protein
VINAPDNPPDFERQLALLRARFTAGLVARRDELVSAWSEWNSLAASADGDRPRAVLAIALHRLAGAALSYGYEALGQDARTLEGRITADGARPEGLAMSFAALIADLSDAYSAASGVPPAGPPAEPPPAAQ